MVEKKSTVSVGKRTEVLYRAGMCPPSWFGHCILARRLSCPAWVLAELRKRTARAFPALASVYFSVWMDVRAENL